MEKQLIGVLLLNMGGPDNQADVAPFLYNLFSDREIIRLGPPWLQKPLAWYIARKRAGKSRQAYASIGGGSPLKRLTMHQAQCLQDSLRDEGAYTVAIAMRYWQPRAAEAILSLLSRDIERIIALTLYPHYSRATTGSSVMDLKTEMDRLCPGMPCDTIESWPDHPLYIDALIDAINQGLNRFDSQDVQIVYSAHSLPVSFIREGDPYVDHILRTLRIIEKRTGRTGRLCYQSRSGPVEWLSPSTPEMIETLAREGVKNILMVPISFVSDHIETLYEIDILYKSQAEKLGIRLRSSPALNSHPSLIACLKDLVLQRSRQ
ncbi:MAG: ferrochelatase [Desulfoprunum sp.]|jgi:ferrochelatase|uniref:ferrochelatase n=1 Tax=Desulfoprunum sp. TaxID=2020866 RepID=UPI00052E14EB|nr:ferrochelatase [Desulfobulbus sp. Tol-SR]